MHSYWQVWLYAIHSANATNFFFLSHSLPFSLTHTHNQSGFNEQNILSVAGSSWSFSHSRLCHYYCCVDTVFRSTISHQLIIFCMYENMSGSDLRARGAKQRQLLICTNQFSTQLFSALWFSFKIVSLDHGTPFICTININCIRERLLSQHICVRGHWFVIVLLYAVEVVGIFRRGLSRCVCVSVPRLSASSQTHSIGDDDVRFINVWVFPIPFNIYYLFFWFTLDFQYSRYIRECAGERVSMIGIEPSAAGGPWRREKAQYIYIYTSNRATKHNIQ